MWERKSGLKNTKICLKHITFSVHTVPNMALYCSSMPNFLVFKTFDVGGFLEFGAPDDSALM